MNFCFFLHAPFEGPAALGDWARSAGHSVEVVKVFAGETPADPDRCDVLVAMGGPMNIYQYRDYPWLKHERHLLEKALSAGKKAVGICLGAQILADILGARVCQNPEREIGWMPVQFTPEAREQFPVLPESQHVLHWHGDTFDLPRGGTRLASTAACENQGYCCGTQILALQFHLEMTPPAIEAILANCRDELQPGPYVQKENEIRGLGALHAAECENLLGRLLERFTGT